MKKLLLFATVLALSVSCIDNDFDLSDVKTDDIGIGSDETVFRLPLANITVMWSVIESNDGGESTGTYDTLDNIFNEADTWIPKNRTELFLNRLGEASYVDGIITDLLSEIETDQARRTQVIEMIKSNSDYAKSIESHIPVGPDGKPVYDINTYINDHFKDFEKDSREALKEIVDKHLESMTNCISEIEQPIDGFGLDDEIIDMLGGGGKMRIYGDITSYLPVKCEGEFRLNGSEDNRHILNFPINLDYNATNEIGTDITKEGLSGMAGDMMLTVAFEPTVYYPRMALPDLDKRDETAALKLKIKLMKTGGLSLGSILGGGDDDDDE